ncbi:MAG: DUF2946 family protein [Comamonadaceae bacterium]|nr:DUF2946 family protein [Comamonadaceae bacterium]
MTARGEWRIRGEPIDNPSIRDFIARNYAHDVEGNWFFQNGPQRVFVSLEATPLIYRLGESGHLQAHTGAHPRELLGAFADAEGRLLLVTELGPGLVDSRDTAAFAEQLVDGQEHPLDEHSLGRWMTGDGAAFLETRGLLVRHDGPSVPVGRIGSKPWPATFGFVAQPGGGKVTRARSARPAATIRRSLKNQLGAAPAGSAGGPGSGRSRIRCARPRPVAPA